MTQLDALRITCRSTGIANHVNIIGFGYSSWTAAISFPDFNDVLKFFQCRATFLSLCCECCIDTLDSKYNQILDLGSLTDLLHVKYLLRIVICTENGRHLRLI